MKDTVSFFFLGTACHHSSYQDVLTTFYKDVKANAKKPESNTAARLFDGVGSDPGQLADTHPTPGRYVYDPIAKVKKKSDETLAGIYDFIKKMTGCLTGDGMDEQLFEATLFLEQLISENDGVLPKTINLHGYSRGCDACVRLANLLDSLYPDIKVNLFLIDHVPGPGRANDPSSYIIPKNVQKIETVVMLHEYKPGFDPQDRNSYVFASPHTTKVAIKVYPGWHNKAVLLTPNENTNDVPKLLHDDFFRFCKETGSLPHDASIPKYKVMRSWTEYTDEEAKVLTLQDRFAHYNAIRNNWWFYEKGTALNKRTVLNNHEHYSQDCRLFVNQEHGELFNKLYPKLYDWFLNGGQKTNAEQVCKELARLRTENPSFYEAFFKLNQITPGFLPPPRKATPYFRRPLGAALVDDERSFLEQAIISVINYEKYHRKDNSSVINKAVIYLQKTLDQTAAQHDKTAVSNLQKAILKTNHYLAANDHKTSYLHSQLSKISFMNEYIDRVQKIIGEHLQKNKALHPDQIRYLQKVCDKFNEIKNNNDLTYLQKFKKAKSIIGSVVFHLEQPRNARICTYNMYQPLFANSSRFTVESLVNALNEHNKQGFCETSLADNIAKRFAAYYKRYLFWDVMHKFVSKFIEIPPFISREKAELAHQIELQLNKHDEIGQGNNLEKISSALLLGQQKMHVHYRKNNKKAEDAFDKIMLHAQTELNLEINASSLEEQNDPIALMDCN